MKKKKQRQTPKATAATTVGEEIESVIHSHAEFFDRLIELIPKKFYQNDDGDSKPYYHGLSKAAKASLKRQSRQNIKLARRQRFDPDHKITEEHVPEDKPIVDAEEEIKEKSVTYEELRQKLRRKIELLRGNRGEKRIDGRRKRKWSAENDEGESGKETEAPHSDEDVEEIEYGKVRLSEDDEKAGKKKRKVSKVHELERVKRLQEVKKEKPSVAEKESWKAATSRAMGVKVHDNARLIKESLKKGKKKKEKNAEKWKERVETQAKFKEDRQRKRKDNIDGRIQDKKMRKIAKREKKLLRPGFEGRKEGFITGQ